MSADASVKALKLYDMKLLALAYLALVDLALDPILNLLVQKVGSDRP